LKDPWSITRPYENVFFLSILYGFAQCWNVFFHFVVNSFIDVVYFRLKMACEIEKSRLVHDKRAYMIPTSVKPKTLYHNITYLW